MITNIPTLDDRANIEAIGAALLSGIAAIIEQHEVRIAELESALASEPAPDVIDFCRTRRTWTVTQLASDLQVHENTVRNWLALPADNSRHLDSFQPGGTGPHMILAQHVADWMQQNRQAA